MSKAHLMTNNDVLLLNIDTEPLDPTQPDQNLKKFSYKLKVQRQTSGTQQMTFTLMRYISSSLNQQIVLNMPYTGANSDWVHFGVSIGYEIIYHIDSSTGKFKRNEGIHSWFDGQDYHSDMSYTETDALTTSYGGQNNKGDKTRLTLAIQLSAYSDSGMTTSVLTNNFGLRVWEAKAATGSFLAYKITNSAVNDNRCFFKRAINANCYLYAFMKNAQDANPITMHGTAYRNRKPTCPSSKCGYCQSEYHCMFAKTGHNEDLFLNPDIRFVRDAWESTAYDPAKPELAAKYVKVTNNLGTDYWVRCPPNCKVQKNYSKQRNSIKSLKIKILDLLQFSSINFAQTNVFCQFL